MPTSFFEWVVFFARKYGLFFLQGAGTTLYIASIGTIIGFVIGLAVAVVRTIPVEKNDSKVRKLFFKIVRWILVAYIEIFRGTPMIFSNGNLLWYG